MSREKVRACRWVSHEGFGFSTMPVLSIKVSRAVRSPERSQSTTKGANFIEPRYANHRRDSNGKSFLVLRRRIRACKFCRVSLHFIKAMMRSPGSVGAIWPSSPFLAKAMVRASSLENAEHVLELGPGTGAFTGEILSSLRHGASFSALEIDHELAQTISKKFPRAKVIAGCATKLGEHLETEKVPPPDAILSGLPWAVFDENLQTHILSQIQSVLRDGGVFSTFAYYGPHRLKGGQAFRRKLENSFSRVERSSVVLRNFPPAFIYTCRP